MSDRLPARAFRFGDFVLDVSAYELRKRGRSIRLERLAMELLILLVGRRGELVTRSEIADRLWGPDVFLEVDASVNTLVRKIRRVLGDSVDDSRFIQTVQGKGYRFSAEVEDVSVPPAPEDPSAPIETPASALPIPEPETAVPARRRLPSRRRLAAGLVAIVLLVLVGRLTWGRLRAGGEISPVTVAVMPFENLSGDPERDYLTDGLTEVRTRRASALGAMRGEFAMAARPRGGWRAGGDRTGWTSSRAAASRAGSWRRAR